MVSASENSDKTLFLLLSMEIRERIYSYCFVDVHYVVELTPSFDPFTPFPEIRILQSENEATPHRLLQSENHASLLRTCRFLRTDAWPSYARHIRFVLTTKNHIPPLKRIKHSEWKDFTQNLHRSMKTPAEVAELLKQQARPYEVVRLFKDQAAEFLHNFRRKGEVSQGKISDFDSERQGSYYQNWHIPALLLSEIIPKSFLRHIRSITGFHLEDLSDQYLDDSDTYRWLGDNELPWLQHIGFERRRIKWEQDIGSSDYDDVMTKLLTPKSYADNANEIRWKRALVHWNTNPTIHFVTKFYAQHVVERRDFLTPVSVDHRTKSVTWASHVTFEFPKWEDGFWVDNLWLHSHRVKIT